MFIQILATIALSFLGGVLYRLGGAAKEGNWYDFLCNTKTRDMGIPALMIVIMLIWGQYHNWQTFLGLFLSFGALFGAQTTYWKKKGTDAKWFNWLFTGLGYSVAMLPLVVLQNIQQINPTVIQTHYLGFAIRTLVCTGLITLASVKIGNAVIEENARGEIELLTLPLLFIG